MKNGLIRFLLLASLAVTFQAQRTFAQEAQPTPKVGKQKVRIVSIPISIFSKRELRKGEQEEFVGAGDLSVIEDGDPQTILSIRNNENVPLSLAIVIQDDLESELNLQTKDIATFIRKLPKGSRVMVAYARSGAIQVRQKFTVDLEKAAKSLRIIPSSNALSPLSPYASVSEVLDRFDSLPTGRRAILLISDGADYSRGNQAASPSESIELDRAISTAQRKSVAVYAFYFGSALNPNSQTILRGQGCLDRLADETGGRAFIYGSSSPISFNPFFRDLVLALNRQFVLTYISTHFKKGYHKLKVLSSNPEIRIEHPKGYFYRKR